MANFVSDKDASFSTSIAHKDGSTPSVRLRSVDFGIAEAQETRDRDPRPLSEIQCRLMNGLGKNSYYGSLAFNFAAYLLPALYLALCKLWIARLDPSFVAITDSYVYIGVVAELINQGLPKAAWLLIGDATNQELGQRYGLANTLIIFETGLAVIMTTVLCAAAPQFTDHFLPETIRTRSNTYVRLSSVSTCCSVVVTSLSTCTRALDQPDVPLTINTVKTVINIILDLLLLSPFRPIDIGPTINTQAVIRLCCDLSAVVCGCAHYLVKQQNASRSQSPAWNRRDSRPSVRALRKFIRKGIWFQIEVCPRTALSLWFTTMVVALGPEFATAWGVFFTIRIGIGFVVLLAVEASCLTWTAHIWATLKRDDQELDQHSRGQRLEQIRRLIRPAISSVLITLFVELLMYISVGFGFGHALAFFLTESKSVAALTIKIWRLVDWCYIFLAMFFQIASILLVVEPAWYLFQSMVVVIFYSLPVNFVFWTKTSDKEEQWYWVLFVLAAGGSSVVGFLNNILWTAAWIHRYLNASGTRL